MFAGSLCLFAVNLWSKISRVQYSVSTASLTYFTRVFGNLPKEGYARAGKSWRGENSSDSRQSMQHPCRSNECILPHTYEFSARKVNEWEVYERKLINQRKTKLNFYHKLRRYAAVAFAGECSWKRGFRGIFSFGNRENMNTVVAHTCIYRILFRRLLYRRTAVYRARKRLYTSICIRIRIKSSGEKYNNNKVDLVWSINCSLQWSGWVAGHYRVF